MKELRFHRLARREISGAYLYYHSKDDSTLAPDFQAKLRSAFLEITQHPVRFSIWEGTEARKYLLERFPFIIVYLEYSDFIRVLAVAHTSRRPGYWKSRIAVD